MAIYRRVPNEILKEIFSHLFNGMAQYPVAFVEFKNQKHLSWLLYLSKDVSKIILEAYYESNYFNFAKTKVISTDGLSDMKLLLPPTGVRHFLRRMDITLILEDFCPFTPGSESRVFRIRPVTTVDELLNDAQGWKTLKNLTDADTGFSRLHHLKVRLIPIFIYRPTVDDHKSWKETLLYRLIKEANIAIKAEDIGLFWDEHFSYPFPPISCQTKPRSAMTG